MNRCVNETELGSPGVQAEAIEILAAVQRRLVNRLAVAVVMNKQQLLGRGTLLNLPLTCDRDLAEIAAGLGQVNHAIAAIGPCSGERADRADHEPAEPRASDDHRSLTFSRFAQLVIENRLEEASRELSRRLRIPHDRAGTATHFFARAAQANPHGTRGLGVLHEQVTTAPAADCIRLLMKTFGLQAIESRIAMEALRSQVQHPGPA
jgi:hypothetical protein